MFKKLLFLPLLVFPISVFGQSVDIAVGTSNSDTTEVCNGASINVSATTSGITSITGIGSLELMPLLLKTKSNRTI